MSTLKVAVPTPETWSFQCPFCEHIYYGWEMDEGEFGSYVVDGPDRFPRCDACDNQFQIAEMQVQEIRNDR